MATSTNIGTRDIPLKLARALTDKVNASWATGDLLAKVTPVTRELLTFWFIEPHTETRYANFHEGQWQAILNTIYLHEVVGIKTVQEIYESIEYELLSEIDMTEFKREKYEIPKYAIKMATGTGKTWVMHALLIWQYLNAKYEEAKSGRYTKNFLLIAPGLIVFDRLLDAYLGKESAGGERQFETSDVFQFQDTFVPNNYREDVFGFIQNAVVQKQDIGKKVTGDGLIAIANWHLFMTDKEESEASAPTDDPSGVVKDIFPVRPGTSGGNALDSLDAQYLSGKEMEYLASLSDLMAMNDEAQWVEGGRTQEDEEKQWQRALNIISKGKGSRFMQVDFSATPYRVQGTGQGRRKHYFLHTIVDFDLKTAIRGGLVKVIALDKRKELTDLPLEYSAVRDGTDVLGLSEGQKLMLRAGLARLRTLDDSFTAFTADKDGVSNKHPKMLVMCEDTKVTPLVGQFLAEEGLGRDDVMRIDSDYDRKGNVPPDEWKEIKQRLFNVDKHEQPKVIVSVLMLREGFDVNNICVLVPLRSAASQILLEQTIGRGLRLMWREPEFADIKAENRRRLLVEKREPENYLDLLTIVEHPAFAQFYDELVNDGLVGEITHDPKGGRGVLGDIIKVELKADYAKYDLFWPVIIRDADEELVETEIDIMRLEPFTGDVERVQCESTLLHCRAEEPEISRENALRSAQGRIPLAAGLTPCGQGARFTLYPLEKLRTFFAKDGERFVAEEMTVKTRFGEYVVDASLFKSHSYNEYLQKIVGTVVNRMERVSQRTSKALPTLQVSNVAVAGTVDRFIRTRLFGAGFDPFAENNWKILLLKNGLVTEHIVKEIGKAVFAMQQSVEPTEAKVEKISFSTVSELRMRENFSLPITKTMYERLPYPSNKGEFEKNFMLYADGDGEVETLMKVNEYYHPFANISYIRTDGLIASYSPDFIVKTTTKMYLIETKADKDLHDGNVRQKQFATLDWVQRINALAPQDRGEREWSYVLLGENNFYSLKDNNASIEEICELAKVSDATARGKLF
ncbi:MAG: DEAD/DEAH box helicase family protein [Patescibacteria group bacterium]